ncbi:MAG: UDP-N-acetylmuramoyl-tripeptide--D-alanyl-D-alanine ligase, partial [Armatimonadetes bacterium]|nr:UDP-N-acetylmuramoyl-tripeptide--D-alanyl-D-alanine ligase [Armatimonadota bacterium]
MSLAADGVLSLAEVAAATGGTLSGGDPSRRVRAVVTDSRAVAPGALFAALRGPRQDGHAFVEAAARGGAVGALVNHPVDAALALIRVPDVLASLLPLAASWRARFAATAIGVTGSAGKTTTVRLLAGMLDQGGGVHASRPSWNAEIGVPMTIFGLRPDHRFVVVEMGMRGRGHIATLCAAARPRIGVVTNVGASHLEELGSLATIARAKAELIDALPAGGSAVINANDPLVGAMRPPAGASILRFGFGAEADVRAEALTMDADGSRFTIVTPHGDALVRLALPGRHLVANALAAAAAAMAAGAPLTAIVAGITTFSPPPMRLEVRALAADVLLVDDSYNASPA